MKCIPTAIGFALWCAVNGALSAAPAAAFDHTHPLFDRVLKRYSKNALVDYATLKANPADLNRYLDGLAAVPESEFNRWSREEQIAYLINLYNASTLRLVIDHYPLKSIKEIGSIVRGPFDQKVVRLFGRTTSPGDLEKDYLRRRYQEPRIHFAIVCASRGCAPLRSEAYTAGKLDQQLDDQARKFMATPGKNRVDLPAGVVYLSPVFKWFKEDFVRKSGSVLAFAKDYFPPDTARRLAGGRFKIEYTNYDWSLNELR
jgi:hypothetical protein